MIFYEIKDADLLKIAKQTKMLVVALLKNL
jgi:hypothetical protein